jgi:hypothetical protein
MTGEIIVHWSVWSQIYFVHHIGIFFFYLFCLLLFQGVLDGSLSFLELSDVANVSSGKFGRKVMFNFVDADFGLENGCWKRSA